MGPTDEETTLDDRMRQILRDLGRALSEALADSSDVDEVLRRVRAEGYNLSIVLDREGGTDREPTTHQRGLLGDERSTTPLASGHRMPIGAGSRSLAPRGTQESTPSFRIDAADLAFLRSIGIDPTRKIRGRKPGRPDPAS